MFGYNDLFSQLFEVFKGLIDLSLVFLNSGDRFFWLYISTSVIICFWIYIKSKSKKIGFVNFIFPKEVYSHPSAKVDFWIIILTPIFKMFLIIPLTGLFSVLSAEYIQSSISYFFISPDLERSIEYIIIYSLIWIILFDFAQYIAHYLQHKSRILWEFHKVHHSAEVLNPMTAYRFHPFDYCFTSVIIGLMTGISYGAFSWLLHEPIGYISFLKAHIVIFLFYMFGYHLRHSHIQLIYPKWLQYILICPSQHQIHHSTNREHFNKNIGFIFAFWDYLFGTLYIADGKKINFGLGKNQEIPYRKLSNIYIMPFINIYKILTRNKLYQKLLFAFGLLLILSYIGIYSFSSTKAYAQENIWLAENTTFELDEKLENGYDRILIPTAGIEQNAQFGTLNKHQKVVEYTSYEIAKKLGNTLIAPIVNFVPQGNIFKKTGHMAFNGTISMPDGVYKAILLNIVLSLSQHGYKIFYFIGDSGGNQKGQKEVAKSLRKKGYHVYSIDEYYANYDQNDYIRNKLGYSNKQIGTHMGIRDTSELMYVSPKSVRNHIITNNINREFYEAGGNGNAKLSSSKLGEEVLNIKINQTIKAIKNIEKSGTDN